MRSIPTAGSRRRSRSPRRRPSLRLLRTLSPDRRRWERVKFGCRSRCCSTPSPASELLPEIVDFVGRLRAGEETERFRPFGVDGLLKSLNGAVSASSQLAGRNAPISRTSGGVSRVYFFGISDPLRRASRIRRACRFVSEGWRCRDRRAGKLIILLILSIALAETERNASRDARANTTSPSGWNLANPAQIGARPRFRIPFQRVMLIAEDDEGGDRCPWRRGDSSALREPNRCAP